MVKQPGPRILLVEDDDDVRETLTRILEDRGYDVYAVRDGATFADTVARGLLLDELFPPAAIITDVRLPDFDGIGVIEGLRLAGWNMPVFVISALPETEIDWRIRRLPGVRMFSKPFDVDRLERELRRAVTSI
jgi:DNA-binding response OmpR family regulator